MQAAPRKAFPFGNAWLPRLLAAAFCMNAMGYDQTSQAIVPAGLPAISKPPPGKVDFIFKIGDTLSTLYDHFLEYGFAPPWIRPCDGSLEAGVEENPLPRSLAGRCRFDTLRAFSKRGVIQLPYPLRFVIDTNEQCHTELRFRIRHEPIPEPLFLSTWKGRGPFLAPRPVKRAPKGLSRPEEARSFTVKTYAHPTDSSLSLSVVHFRHILPPKDDGYVNLPAREETVGELYLNRGDKPSLLTGPFDFGESGLAGFMDVNGDGELDILIGDPVDLILERYEDGFRLWWWPIEPHYGC